MKMPTITLGTVIKLPRICSGWREIDQETRSRLEEVMKEQPGYAVDEHAPTGAPVAIWYKVWRNKVRLDITIQPYDRPAEQGSRFVRYRAHAPLPTPEAREAVNMALANGYGQF